MAVVGWILAALNGIIFLVLLAAFVDMMREPAPHRRPVSPQVRRQGPFLIRLWEASLFLYVLAWIGHTWNLLGLQVIPLDGILLTLGLACTIGVIRIQRNGRVF